MVVRRTLIVAVLLAASTARGQGARLEDEHIRRGIADRLAHQDEAALDEFRQAYAVSRSPHAVAQMALAEQALGRWVDSEAHLREALAAESDPWVHKNSSRLQGALTELAPHLGTLEVTSNVAGAELWLAGARVGALPAKARVAAGRAEIEVRASGHATQTQTTEISPGETTRLVLDEATPPAPPASAPPLATPAVKEDATTPEPAARPSAAAFEVPPAEPRPKGGSRTLAWVLIGGGAAVVGGAVAATVIAEKSRSDYNDNPSCNSWTCPGTASAYNTGVALAITGYAVGGAAIGAGLWIALFKGESGGARSGATACAPGGAGVICRVTF